MAFEKKVPEWKAAGTEPPESLKTSGFQAKYKPPAAYFNWFWHGVSEALSELQSGAVQGRQTLTTGTDLNTVTVSGFYRLNSGHKNAPEGSSYGQLLVMHGGGDTIAQLCANYIDGSLWVRGGNPSDVSGVGTWNEWKRLSTVDDVPDQLLCNKYTITSTQDGGELDDLLETIISGMGTVTMCHVSVHDANGKSALGGGTSFLTVCKYNDNHVVISAHKYNESGALRTRTKISGTWSDWQRVYTTGNKPTPADIGAVSKEEQHASVMSVTAYASEDAINDFYDNYSADFAERTKYEGAVFHNMSHSVLGGGLYYLNGFKGSGGYEWQEVKSYRSGGPINHYARSMVGGVWTSWERVCPPSTTYTATVTTSWTASGDYYYQDITTKGLSGILATDNPVVDINPSSDNAANVLYSEAICKVFRITTSANSIRVWATEAIGTTFPIQLKVVR